MDLPLFEQSADILRGLVPPQLGTLRCRPRRYGMKVWFGPERPPREHYEAQVLGAEHCAGATLLSLEIGFHAEHPDPADNASVTDRLTRAQRTWRRHLGPEAEVGPFLGRGDWRRVSETWPDPDLGDAELAFEIAARLTDYVTALEPVLRKGPGRRAGTGTRVGGAGGFRASAGSRATGR